MNIDELLKFRIDLLSNSCDENEFISPELVLGYVLPSLVETKLIESEEINFLSINSFYSIAGFCENESGERLQIFLVDTPAISINAPSTQIIHSKKDNHNSFFKLGSDFVKKSIKRHLNDELQDSDPLAILYQKLASSAYVDQIDVIEFILLSTSVSVENRGKEQAPKRFIFEDEKMKVSFSRNRDSLSKDILIQYKLVDIAYLYQVSISQGNSDPLNISFTETFGCDIEVLKAAEEEHFESYLCVIPALGLANLYRKESSRLLEKNVRSFLNFKVEANKEMRRIIRVSPEKFIAYNNGLTITGSSGEILKKDNKYFIKTISDFQIVNGGQTTASIYFSHKDGLDISKINLMAKINIAKDVTVDELNDLIGNISRYSNTQTKVSKVDLKTSNLELKLIKNLSISVVAPNQNKWFFDLAKGEFNTLVKLRGNLKKLEKDFPKHRRFTKEELGKFYTSWGLAPYLVKLGGDKVFRYFIEEISGDEDKKRPKTIDRSFYEQLIAKIILFRELEKLHGFGKNAIGQLRSAVIPYSISALYLFMNADKNKPNFHLELIWKQQGLDENMNLFFIDLMRLMNNLIKEYAQSDDYGTYSKKEQLWNDISKSKELNNFFNSNLAINFIEKYGISKNKVVITKEQNELNFSELEKTVRFASYGVSFFKNIVNGFYKQISNHEEDKIMKILHQLKIHKDIGPDGVSALDSLIEKARINQPALLKTEPNELDALLIKTYDGILKIYNNSKQTGNNIESEFEKHYLIALRRNIKYAIVFKTIGKKLGNNLMITLSDIYKATHYFKS